MKKTTITVQDMPVTVWLFKNRDPRLRHVFKHFLNPSEPWQTLDGITLSKGKRIRARKTVARTGCAGADHRRFKCRNYSECSRLLADNAPEYIQKAASVLRETAASGAILFCGAKAPMLCLSAEGVLLIARTLPESRSRQWNLATCYLPYDNRFEFPSDITPYERFFEALDHVYRKFCRDRAHGNPDALNNDLWNSYFDTLYARSRIS